MLGKQVNGCLLSIFPILFLYVNFTFLMHCTFVSGCWGIQWAGLSSTNIAMSSLLFGSGGTHPFDICSWPVVCLIPGSVAMEYLGSLLSDTWFCLFVLVQHRLVVRFCGMLESRVCVVPVDHSSNVCSSC